MNLFCCVQCLLIVFCNEICCDDYLTTIFYDYLHNYSNSYNLHNYACLRTVNNEQVKKVSSLMSRWLLQWEHLVWPFGSGLHILHTCPVSLSSKKFDTFLELTQVPELVLVPQEGFHCPRDLCNRVLVWALTQRFSTSWFILLEGVQNIATGMLQVIVLIYINGAWKDTQLEWRRSVRWKEYHLTV